MREAEGKLSSQKDFLLIKKNFETETSDPEKRIGQMEKYGIDMQVLTQIHAGPRRAECSSVRRDLPDLERRHRQDVPGLPEAVHPLCGGYPSGCGRGREGARTGRSGSGVAAG